MAAQQTAASFEKDFDLVRSPEGRNNKLAGGVIGPPCLQSANHWNRSLHAPLVAFRDQYYVMLCTGESGKAQLPHIELCFPEDRPTLHRIC